MSNSLLELDGSFGEGGGQILRTSLALSLLTGQGFHLRNVRAGRTRPGLQPQHLQSVLAAAEVGQAEVRGATRGSTDLVFEPGEVRSGTYRFDIGTAGATALVLQTIYLPLALRGQGPSEITLVGGTHTSTSPCFHFLDFTWRPYLERLGLHLSLQLLRPGFYPRGGGVVQAFVQATDQLTGCSLLQRGELEVKGFSAVAGLPEHIARRQARQLRHFISRFGMSGIVGEVREESWEGGPGTVVGVEVSDGNVASLFFALGARGKPAEHVADEAGQEALAYIQGEPVPVDPHSADQILLPLALAKGPSEYATTEVTLHLTTNLAMIQQFLDREIICEGEMGQPGVVRIP